MAVYLVTGRLGAGKSLVCVGRIRDALIEGRRVATNLNLEIDALLGKDYAKHVDCIRVPDKPTVRDLEAIGAGNPTMDETRNGVIVLDELAAWMNARSWGDKERQPVLDWLIHSRKKGWDVIFICQHLSQVDKQLREALVEFHVGCRRIDRLKLPMISSVGQLLTLGLWDGRMPRVHIGIVRYGTSPTAVIAERWVFRASNLFAAYDTRQIFTDESYGPYSYVPPRLLHVQKVGPVMRLLRWLKGERGRSAVAAPLQVARPGGAISASVQLPAVARLMQFPVDQRPRLYRLAQQARVIPQ